MPIKEISAESVRDKSICLGHISTLHLWWAIRPLPALAGTFSQWKETLHSLDELGLNPHPTSVSLIMEYAAKLQETV